MRRDRLAATAGTTPSATVSTLIRRIGSSDRGQRVTPVSGRATPGPSR